MLSKRKLDCGIQNEIARNGAFRGGKPKSTKIELEPGGAMALLTDKRIAELAEACNGRVGETMTREQAIRQAVSEAAEEAAKICNVMSEHTDGYDTDDQAHAAAISAMNCAAAIRERGRE